MFDKKTPFELDNLAVDLVSKFSKQSSELPATARWFLWDKIGRAIRQKVDAEKTNKEIEILESTVGNNYYKIFANPTLSLPKLGVSYLYSYYIRTLQKLLKRKIIYNPCLVSYSRPIIKELKKTINSTLVYDGCFKGVNSFRRKFIGEIDKSVLENIVNYVEAELKTNQLKMTDFDKGLFYKQLCAQYPYIIQTEQDLLTWKPDMLLLGGCLYPPHLEYVANASKLNIPTILLQHGLDCEPGLLDLAPVTTAAVWGSHREDRYKKANQSCVIKVTGNPAYDHLRQAETIRNDGKYILFTTRPHRPERCYLPSRWHDEGFKILREIINKFPNYSIVVKPHVGDFFNEYISLAKELNAENRVTVSKINPQELFADAMVVISEDSTIAAEAMISGKVVVIAQFSGTKPTLSVEEFEAANVAYDAQSLFHYVDNAMKLNGSDLSILHKKQSEFLNYTVGPLDGKSIERLASFIRLTI